MQGKYARIREVVAKTRLLLGRHLVCVVPNLTWFISVIFINHFLRLSEMSSRRGRQWKSHPAHKLDLLIAKITCLTLCLGL